MTAQTVEFKAQYEEYYGYSFSKMKPDYSRCAASVFGRERGSGTYQCHHKNGHGPHGAWCKKHNPEAVKARNDANLAAFHAKLDKAERLHKANAALETALRQIADGHNDPRALAQSIIIELDDARK